MENIFSDKLVEELDRVGICMAMTRGNSMRPFLKEGRDTVYVTKKQEFRLRDVVLYRLPSGQYVMHRIVGRRGETYLVRGDNTYITERWKKSDFLGALSEFDRKGKHGTVRDLSFRLYSFVWWALYPLRYPAVKVRHALRRLLRK